MRTGKDIACEYCGKTFYASGWELKSGTRKFCSKACSNRGTAQQNPPPEIRIWQGMTVGPVPAHMPHLGNCWERPCNMINLGKAQGKRLMVAARFVWQMYNGPIPERHYICHHCDNPKCIRPDHLFLGTPRDNALDMVAKGRHGTKQY